MSRLSRRECLAALAGGLLSGFASLSLAGERAPIRDPEHVFSGRVCSYRELQRRNVVMQDYDYSCGAAALATIFQYYWDDPVTERQILKVLFRILTPEELVDRTKNGMAISDLRQVSVQLGYLASIGTVSLDQLMQSKIPLIVPIRLKEFDHFVVYRGVAGGRVYLADPIRGNVRPTIAEFCQQWNKHAILVVVKKGMIPPQQSRLTIRCDEVMVGETSEEWVNKQLPQPLHPPSSIPMMVH